MKLKQRPYIIINNKRSDLIEGLLITNSPTISKPPKRVNIEEVDGKDGYFINELGYSGYDKEVGIGLYGNYNIDNVIGYLSQNGTIVFSNEPDKVYTFNQTEQIDFERLVRYKTATVKYRVQPFKHKINEQIRTETGLLTVYNEGNIQSKPIITIKGNGNFTILLNNKEAVKLVNVQGNITLNVEDLNAYNNGNLYNRHVQGNLENLTLPMGKSEINILGSLESATIEKISRWI